MTLSMTRRTVLGTAVVGTVVAASRIHQTLQKSPAGLVIVQPNLPESAITVITERHPGALVVELQTDVVRHWRSSLGEVASLAGGAKAYVPWAQALVLAGLVREAGGTATISEMAKQVFETRLMLGPKA